MNDLQFNLLISTVIDALYHVICTQTQILKGGNDWENYCIDKRFEDNRTDFIANLDESYKIIKEQLSK